MAQPLVESIMKGPSTIAAHLKGYEQKLLPDSMGSEKPPNIASPMVILLAQALVQQRTNTMPTHTGKQ
eukprot:4431747-Amphidinium_carterae.1